MINYPAMLPIDKQMAVMTRGIVDLHTKEELLAKLRRDKPLTVKLGIDPTYTDIHLGHTVVLRKMRQFQDLGHRAVLIIGDFTAQIGDPTGRSKTRPQLTKEQVEENAKTYVEQIAGVLDMNKLEIVRNGEWLEPMNFHDVVQLAANFTVARILEREDFAQRYKGGNPISLHEFLYVLMQSYDSVHLKADVELGGHDQLFNLMAGRDLMREKGMEPQIALTVPLLVGTDGDLKMSKSYGNHIGIKEPPFEMYSKVMSIADNLMESYFTLLTDVELDEVQSLCDASRTHPKEAKQRLAKEIVSKAHSADAAAAAADRWNSVFSERAVPEDIPELKAPGAKVGLVDLLMLTKIPPSKSEARRLIEGGGVELDNARVTDPKAQVDLRAGMILRVGKKKRFFKIVL